MIPCQAHASQVARQHYSLQLKKKVWSGWLSLIQKHWKVKVERTCRARAEEVCTQLSAEYEAKLAEVSQTCLWNCVCVCVYWWCCIAAALPHWGVSLKESVFYKLINNWLSPLLHVSTALWGHREGTGRDPEAATRARALWRIYEEGLHEGRVCAQHGGSRHVPHYRGTAGATSSPRSARSVSETFFIFYFYLYFYFLNN